MLAAILAQAQSGSGTGNVGNTFLGIVFLVFIILGIALTIMWIKIPLYLRDQLKVQKEILAALQRIEASVQQGVAQMPPLPPPPPPEWIKVKCPICTHPFEAERGEGKCPRCGEKLRIGV